MEQERKMSSGEALAEILERVTRIEDRLDQFAELAETLVDQVSEIASSGAGQLLGGLLGGKGLSPDDLVSVANGDSEHSQDPE